MPQPRHSLRRLIEGSRCIAPVSVFDPITARMAEEAGAPALMLAGSVASLVVLGDPDLTTLTLTEFAALARRITRASDVPLIVDADHGYGNALNVRRTVAELEHAGIAALTIEDTLLPRRFGSGARPELISIAEATGKLHAAVAGRTDPDLVLIGRTGAAGLEDMADTLARIRAFAETGVDMIMVRGVQSQAQIDAISAASPLPVFLATSDPALRDLEALSRTNVRIVLQGHRPLMAAYHAAAAAMEAQLSGTSAPEGIAGETLKRLSRADDFDALMRDTLEE